MDKTILNKILAAWFDSSRYLTGEADEYGDTRYVGLHGGRCSEVVKNIEQKDTLTFYEIDRGMSYLCVFWSDSYDPDGQYHAKNMALIGMTNNEHDFKFELVRNYSECHTTVTMIK